MIAHGPIYYLLIYIYAACVSMSTEEFLRWKVGVDFASVTHKTHLDTHEADSMGPHHTGIYGVHLASSFSERDSPKEILGTVRQPALASFISVCKYRALQSFFGEFELDRRTSR